jgi:hypothetical protein
VDAGIDDVPTATLDFHQLEIADLAGMHPVDDLTRVAANQQTVRHAHRDALGLHHLENTTPGGGGVAKRLFDNDALEVLPQRVTASWLGGKVETQTTSVGHSRNIC